MRMAPKRNAPWQVPVTLDPKSGNGTTDDADNTDMQRLAASVTLTRWVSVFSRIGRSKFIHPRNLCHPWSIPSPFPSRHVCDTADTLQVREYVPVNSVRPF